MKFANQGSTILIHYCLLGVQCWHTNCSFTETQALLGIFSQLLWNQLWQTSHIIIFCPLSGCLQLQNIASFSDTSSVISLAVLLASCVGKRLKLPREKHSARCSLIASCFQFCVTGSSPKQRAVAQAIAKRPQSLAPLCFWMGGHFITMWSSLV